MSATAKLIKIIPLAVVLGAFIAVSGFFGKRSRLQGTATGGQAEVDKRESRDDLYDLERRLLRAVGGRPKGEIQLDVFVWVGAAVFFLFWRHVVDAFKGNHTVNWRLDPRYIALGFLVCAVVVLVSSFRRPWAWRA